MSNDKIGATFHPGGPTPDPAYIQKNIESLSKIGGIYDAITLEVERRHAEILAPWRLDNGAKSALELLAEQGRQPEHNTQ